MTPHSQNTITLELPINFPVPERPSRRLKAHCFAGLGNAPPPREWLVEGLIPFGCVTFISGDGGLGKTLIGQQLIMAAALGADWLGRPTARVGSVALFCEDDATEIQRRAIAIARHYRVSLDDPRLLAARYFCEMGEDNALTVPYGATPGDWPLRTTALYATLRDWSKQRAARLLLLDSLHDIFIGNENHRPEAKAFVRLLGGVAREIDGAVVVLAHPSVSGFDRGGTSGSTAWHNAVRSRLYLTRAKDGDREDESARILRTVKANYGGAGKPIRLLWRDGVFVTVSEARRLDHRGPLREVP